MVGECVVSCAISPDPFKSNICSAINGFTQGPVRTGLFIPVLHLLVATLDEDFQPLAAVSHHGSACHALWCSKIQCAEAWCYHSYHIMFAGYHEDKFQRQVTTDCSIIKRKGEKNAFHPGAVMVKLQLPHDAEHLSLWRRHLLLRRKHHQWMGFRWISLGNLTQPSLRSKAVTFLWTTLNNLPKQHKTAFPSSRFAPVSPSSNRRFWPWRIPPGTNPWEGRVSGTSTGSYQVHPSPTTSLNWASGFFGFGDLQKEECSPS